MGTNQMTPPGAPGIAPRWTSSSKSAVGTALGRGSRVWYTMSHGILNEIYANRLDTACVRDFGFIVTAQNYFSEDKRDANHNGRMVEDGVPAFRMISTARDGRYRITKTVLSDPEREVVLQEVIFEPLIGAAQDYRVHAIIAPHLVNAGMDNTAWYDDYKGHPMLFAEGGGTALAVASSVPWLARSAGYVGVSDGWQTLSRGEGLKPEYQRAERGNVAISGTIDFTTGNGRAVLALGFGSRPEEAAFQAVRSMRREFDETLAAFSTGWRNWQKGLVALDERPGEQGLNRYRVSTSVLATHRGESSGAIIASLSIPWGFSKGDNDLGGYHLVWPRDLVEIAGGFLAAGDGEQAKSILEYLATIQESDGHWVQNSWLDGKPYWNGVQIDETALPILLYDQLWRGGVLTDREVDRFNAMIEAAAGFIVRNGPTTQQDRWEEDGGYTPFTLAAEIAALLAAADAMDRAGKTAIAEHLRQVADGWNEQIEKWTYVVDTELSRNLGIEGYYVRIGLPDLNGGTSSRGRVAIANRANANSDLEADLLLSPDALALVRFGLRAADDPRITNTVTAIDAVLKRELPAGPYWYRYNGDGYGEHSDGSPFNGTGIGRLWPLLTGERAHYELALGRQDEAHRLLATFEASANRGGLLPEQIWDMPDIPQHGLFLGKPSGSAMPLAWAHAEHIKLLRSLRDGAVFDMPPQTTHRYVKNRAPLAPVCWRIASKIPSITIGRILRIELLAPARVRWSADHWSTFADSDTKTTGLGIFVLDLQTEKLSSGCVVSFTFFWTQRNAWEGSNFEVFVSDSALAH